MQTDEQFFLKEQELQVRVNSIWVNEQGYYFPAKDEWVLHGLSFVMLYVDDVVIFSRSIDERLHHCREVFAEIAHARVKIKVAKHSFTQS